MNMKFSVKLFSALVAIGIIFGCGGGTGVTNQTTVSGVVLDVNGEVVRNARVFFVDGGAKISYTNSSGAFVLEGVGEGIVKLVADLKIGNVNYVGENWVETFANERTKNLIIVIGREDQMATMEGTVTDRFGAPLERARVHANAGYLGSSLAYTDSSGRYQMNSVDNRTALLARLACIFCQGA